ncbi:hypothetical protein Tco_0901200, partial [Tanacetum coccineum]
RPCLATAHTEIDVFRKLISLEVGNEKLMFNIDNFNETLKPIELQAGYSEDSKNFGDEKKELTRDLIEESLDDDWYTRTIDDDDDDLDCLVDYVELKSHDGFVDTEDEAYKERMCKLLEISYKKPSPITIKKVEVTRYTADQEESYIKVKIMEI